MILPASIKTAFEDLFSRVSSYNPDYYPVVGSSFSADAIKQLFNDVGGDKKIDAQFAVKGMLKKVTYPTGGSSSFEYESHTTGKMDAVLPTTKENVSLYKSLPPDGRADVITVTTPIIPFEQYRVEFFPTVSGHCTTSPQNVNFQVTVKEIQSNTNVPLEEFDGATYSLVNTPKRILWNDLVLLTIPKRYFFTFKQGKSYTISISLLSHHTCVDAYGELNFSYYSQNTTQQWVNTPIGGMRINKITTADLTGNEQIKRYYYGSDLNNLNRSTGKARIVEPAINYFESLTNVPNGEVSEEVSTLIANLNSNPLHDLYNAQGYHITYSTVIESNGNNFEGGATVHNFNTVTETPPIHYRDPVMGTPFQNDFGNGEELKTIFYKNVGAFVKVSETNRTYITDSRLNHTLSAFRATKRSSSYINSAETYNLSVYGIRSQWRYLSSSAETTYDQSGGNGSTQTTNYEYASQVHMQPTAIADIFEDATTTNQRMLYKRYYFPTDYTFPGTLTGTAAAIKTIVDKHIFNVPIEQLNFSVMGSSNLNLIGANLTTYKMNGSKVVKDKDYTLKSTSSTIYQDLTWVTYANINASGQFVFDSHYEPLNSYNRYDTVNNILEVADRKSISSFIREPVSGDVWAKVANGSYTGAAYSSFEHSTASAFTNWTYNLAGIVSLTDAQNGAKAFTLSAANPINSAQTLSSAQKYKVSFWRKTSGGTTFSVKASGVTVTLRTGPVRKGWQYYEGTFTGATTVQITGNATIDELRLYPQNSRMSSYVYKDGVGPISQCNENNQNTFWEYDEFRFT